jgi:hypothetical protein
MGTVKIISPMGKDAFSEGYLKRSCQYCDDTTRREAKVSEIWVYV